MVKDFRVPVGSYVMGENDLGHYVKAQVVALVGSSQYDLMAIPTGLSSVAKRRKASNWVPFDQTVYDGVLRLDNAIMIARRLRGTIIREYQQKIKGVKND